MWLSFLLASCMQPVIRGVWLHREAAFCVFTYQLVVQLLNDRLSQ